MRSPRLLKRTMRSNLPLRRRRWRSEIGAAPARQELAVLVEHLRLRGRELTSHANYLAARSEITGHGSGVVIDAQVDRRHATAGLLHHGPVGSEIDECGQNPTVSVPPLRIDHP